MVSLSNHLYDVWVFDRPRLTLRLKCYLSIIIARNKTLFIFWVKFRLAYI
jgi:hypothetical protein